MTLQLNKKAEYERINDIIAEKIINPEIEIQEMAKIIDLANYSVELEEICY